MKKVFISIAFLALTGCSKSNATEDYDSCNEECAEASECTMEEFQEWLMDDAEYNKLIPFSELNPSNQSKVLGEMEDKVVEIFGD